MTTNSATPVLKHAFKKLYTADELTFGPPSLSSASSSRSTFLTSCGGDDALEDWVYWQRDAHNATCWTKVFAVLENEFLWLFKSEKRAKSLFMQIAVATVEASGDRQLRIVDPNGEDLELWLRDNTSFELWHARLHEASATTDTYFRTHALEVAQLPKSSAYRGSLVAYRRVGTRDKCRALLARLVGNWRLKRSRRTLTLATRPYSIA